MKTVLRILPIGVVTGYSTAAHVVAFRLPGFELLSLAGLILLIPVLYALKKRNGLSAIEIGFLLFLAVNAAAFLLLPENIAFAWAAHPMTILYATLLIVVALPAFLLKRYFTEYFARKSNPEAVWKTSVFKTINRNMTYGWAALFAACLMVTLVPGLLFLEGSRATGIIFEAVLPALLLLGIGLPFTRKYPDYYLDKMGLGSVRAPDTGTEEVPSPPSSISRPATKEEIMSTALKVIAVNGSPHMTIGNTSLMIQMVRSVLSEEGIEVEQVFLADKRIEFCVGCGVCMEKGRCWKPDDHAAIIEKLLAADGIILASPVYFRHVTAQMKTFIDRSLSYGHKPRTAWKPGLAITVSGGMGEVTTAQYLAGVLRVYGAFSVGMLTALSVSPGAFLGKDLVEARARDLGRDLTRAIKEKRRYPATEDDLFFYHFMGDLVNREKEFMRDDYKHWQESGLFGGFETYIGQSFSKPSFDPEFRQNWIKGLIKEEKTRSQSPKPQASPSAAGSCRELLKMMPQGFKSDAAGLLTAVYQFEISGSENFTAHLKIADGRCVYVDGPHDKPDVIIKAPAEVWLSISRGEMDGQTAFMTGKYKVEGDISLLMKLKGLFGP